MFPLNKYGYILFGNKGESFYADCQTSGNLQNTLFYSLYYPHDFRVGLVL